MEKERECSVHHPKINDESVASFTKQKFIKAKFCSLQHLNISIAWVSNKLLTVHYSKY